VSLSEGPTHTLWGPAVTDPQDSLWLGADRPTNNTGGISAYYYALTRALDSFVPLADRRLTSSLTEGYCVRLFADDSIKPRRNRKIIQRVRRVLLGAEKRHDLSISWTKAHTACTTPAALRNASADELAARGSTGSPSLTSPLTPPAPFRSPARRELGTFRTGARQSRPRSTRDPRLF